MINTFTNYVFYLWNEQWLSIISGSNDYGIYEMRQEEEEEKRREETGGEHKGVPRLDPRIL